MLLVSNTKKQTSKQNLSPFQVIDQIGQIVAFNKGYAKKLGNDPLAGLFLSQAIYWHNKGRGKDENGDGWFYKSREDWQDELCITFREQERIRKVLLKTGFWSEDYRRLEHKLYFKIDKELFNKWFIESCSEISEFDRNQDVIGKVNKPEILVGEKASKIGEILDNNPCDADSHNVFPQTTKTHFGKQQKRTSYITETTYIDKEYIYKEDKVLFYFYKREESESGDSSPDYLLPNHKFDLKVLNYIRSRSPIDDKSLISLIKKFIEYYTNGKGNKIAGATLDEWDKIFSLNWIDNWNSWNKVHLNPVKLSTISKKRKVKECDEIIKECEDLEARELLNNIRIEVGDLSFKTWFGTFGSFKVKDKLEDIWTFTVDKPFAQEWLERNYKEQILNAL
jgi:hypothetical protein